MTYYNKGRTEVNHGCPMPPYNSIRNPNVSTLSNLTQFPLDTGSNSEQIQQNVAAFTYFNGLNQQIYNTVQSNNQGTKLPYPVFKSHGERMLYLQGQTIAAAKHAVNNTTPVSTMYTFINGK